jgi:hypothetical protein
MVITRQRVSEFFFGSVDLSTHIIDALAKPLDLGVGNTLVSLIWSSFCAVVSVSTRSSRTGDTARNSMRQPVLSEPVTRRCHEQCPSRAQASSQSPEGSLPRCAHLFRSSGTIVSWWIPPLQWLCQRFVGRPPGATPPRQCPLQARDFQAADDLQPTDVAPAFEGACNAPAPAQASRTQPKTADCLR